MNFTILNEESIAQFQLTEVLYDISFSTCNKTFKDAAETIKTTISNLVENLKEKMKRNDKISLTLTHSQFSSVLSIPFVDKQQFTTELVFDSLTSVTQSYKDVFVNTRNSFSAKAQISHTIRGSGRRALNPSEKKPKYIKKHKVPKEISPPRIQIIKSPKICKPKTRIKNLKKKQKLYIKIGERKLAYLQTHLTKNKLVNFKSIIPVYNTDRSCLIYSILIAKSYYDFQNDKNKIRFKKLNTHNRAYAFISKSELKLQAKVIRNKLNLKNRACGIKELQRIEMLLKNYSITLIDGQDGAFNKKILYEGIPNKHFLYILYTGSHYDVIPSIRHFFKSKNYCNYCKESYHQTHACKNTCKICLRQNCLKPLKPSILKCVKCSAKANNLDCYRYHCEIICKNKTFCETCGQVFLKKHVCFNQKYCVNCKQIVEETHLCYLQANRFPMRAKKNFVFFDYETMQINGKHVPNLICAKFVCKDCLDNTEENRSQDCIECETMFFDNNRDFGEWIFSKKDTIGIAHNLRSFDGIILLEHILEIMNIKDKMPKVLLNGAKILSMQFRKVKFIDSLSFLPMALDKFAKTFDLKTLKKGWFPHKYNLPQNQNYVGPLPDACFYDEDFISKDKIDDFRKFYKENKNSVFDFKKELKSYCESDVDLLKNGCLAFRKIIKDLTRSEKFPDGIDPFTSAITIASLSSFIFRNTMLEKNKIAIIPEEGYNANNKHSIKSIEWLNFLAHRENIKIQHARNGGEIRIGNFVVDGFCELESYCKIYEFFGCFYHSCKLCYNQSSFNTTKQMSMAGVRVLHEKRLKILKNSLYNNKPIKVISIWECDWDRLKKYDNDVKEFLENNPVIERLKPREAFFGGRCEAACPYFKCQSHQKIKYVDYTSLYPYVQKYCDYPEDHPEIITSNFGDVNKYFGLIKCKILPPKNLYFPVLPVRSNGRLLFPLCSKCAQSRSNKCRHNDEQRALVGVWVSEEIQEALKQNYKLISIYEVWHFPKKSNKLFKIYINAFLKGKQTASGFPDGCDTEEQRLKYIQDYFDNEGVLLDINEIFLNSGWRAINKLLLNNLWGKLAEQYNKTQFKIISDPKEWFLLISDDSYIVQRVDFSNNKYLQVRYQNRDDLNKCQTKTNIVLASFVTCYGRLKLYEEMKKLGNRLLYSDTDCYFYWTEPGLYEPKTGSYLGQLTNEISKEKGNYIIEMIAIAEKFYGYETDTGYTHSLCKGIAFSHLSSQKISIDVLRDLVLKDTSNQIEIDQRSFITNNKKWTIKTEITKKVIKNTFNKRIILSNMDETVPYGYKY